MVYQLGNDVRIKDNYERVSIMSVFVNKRDPSKTVYYVKKRNGKTLFVTEDQLRNDFFIRIDKQGIHT
jgi:hypothetical protein